MRGYAKSGVLEQVRAAGGEIYAITSEPQSLATEAEQTWQIGFPAIGDPHHEVRKLAAERGWLKLFYNPHITYMQTRSWTAHPNGYYQPGVLALTREGRVLYRWRSRPTRRNLSGTLERPTPEHVWQHIQASFDSDDDAAHDDTPSLDSKAPPWPVFLTLLFAHGWFVKPKVFPLGRDDEKQTQPQEMFPRIAGFALLWIAIFSLLPLGWSLGLLAGYAIGITPGLIEVHKEFQNSPTGEPT